jgi:hypothetical protein
MIDDPRILISRSKTRLSCQLPRRLLGSLALLGCIAFTTSAMALQVTQERLGSLVVHGLRWEPMQTMLLSGVPAYLRPFSSGNAAVPVARSLAANTDLFQRMLTIPGTIVLSGLQADWHWLARVDVLAEGAKGYVSAMHISPAWPGADQEGDKPGFTWLPAQAQRRFVYRSGMASPTVAQHIYSIALPVQALTAYLRRQLRVEGWEAEPTVAVMPGYSAWRRQTSRLMLFTQAGAAGTDLYIHHVE